MAYWCADSLPTYWRVGGEARIPPWSIAYVRGRAMPVPMGRPTVSGSMFGSNATISLLVFPFHCIFNRYRSPTVDGYTVSRCKHGYSSTIQCHFHNRRTLQQDHTEQDLSSEDEHLNWKHWCDLAWTLLDFSHPRRNGSLGILETISSEHSGVSSQGYPTCCPSQRTLYPRAHSL